jgi:hypothetical protein
MPVTLSRKFTPTSRSYKPGKYPQSQFQATNGATTVVQYGSQCYNSELSMTFANIRDERAAELMDLYYEVNGKWDYLVIEGIEGEAGVDNDPFGAAAGIKDLDLRDQIREKDRILKYRFKEPPTLTSVIPGVSTVSMTLVGYLDGG